MSQTGTASTRRRRVVRVVALLTVAAGLAVGFAASWQWWNKVRSVSDRQATLDRALDENWRASRSGAAAGATAQAGRPAGPGPVAATGLPTAPRDGAPIARLHIPTIGVALVVVEGAGEAQLKNGPGRMINTARLGEPGNAAVAGHRYPGVFWDLDRLVVGDPIVVETGESWLVYRAVRTVIVEPTDESVLADPVPRTPVVLTLVTCEPKFSTAQRLVKQAVLVRTEPRRQPRDASLPRELATRTRL